MTAGGAMSVTFLVVAGALLARQAAAAGRWLDGFLAVVFALGIVAVTAGRTSLAQHAAPLAAFGRAALLTGGVGTMSRSTATVEPCSDGEEGRPTAERPAPR